MKTLVLALSAFSLLASSGSALAAGQQCRDKSGKFVKCPAKVPAKPKMCRDNKGHFTKCTA